jgi:phage anti-repressor protein
MEEWKRLERMPRYEVSSNGKVRSTKHGKQRILKTCVNNYGYELVCLFDGKKRYTSYIHRLIAEVFIPTSNMALVVNHKDKNRKNNTIENLEWTTAMANMWHRDDTNNYNKHSELSTMCKSMDIRQLEKMIALGKKLLR